MIYTCVCILTLFFFKKKGTNTNLDLHLQGAPNFRVAELDVYGVAQPTVSEQKIEIKR